MASEPLKKLLQDVNTGQLVLPQFQRDFVWQPSSVLKLLTSLFNGYPIGSLLLMENNKTYDFRLIDGVPQEVRKDDQENVLILDGQQRLTACYRAFFGTLKDGHRFAGRYYFSYSDFVKKTEAGEEVDGSM